ncbi:MAG TPA: prolipoprotein diacylglyceryl transferase [Opitutaceae bacterium]
MTVGPAFWVDSLDPFLVHFTPRFGIRYYGLAYAAGFLAAAWLLGRYARLGRSLLPASRIGDFMVAAVVGVVVGGRVGSYLLYDTWRTFPSDPLGLFRVWDGGMSFHGGLIGVIIAVTWFARAERIPTLHLWDIVATTAPAGLFFGRIANFVNGELWGRVTDVPWAVIFPRSADPGTPVEAIAPRHPSQLYEAALEGLLLFAFMQWRLWKSEAIRERPGRLAGEFLVGYACFRIAGEGFREPDASLILGLSRGTFYSLFMIASGLYLRQRRGTPVPLPGPKA